MDIASPFSLLDRMKPEQAALRAGRMLAAGVAGAGKPRVDSSADTAAPGVADTVARDRRDFGEFVVRVDRGDTDPPATGDAPPPAATSLSPGPILFDRIAQTAARPAAPRSAAAAGNAPEPRIDGMAETVVAAGVDGLDALARSPVARLAAGLAQVTYATLRPPI